MLNVNYTRPFLYPKQLRAIFPDKRWALCEASTKSGKTVGAIARIVEAALAGQPGQNFWWIAPVANQARIAFTRVKANLTEGIFKPYEHPEMMVRLVTGTNIVFKSADNPDSLYGEDVFGAVMDEASRAKADAWYAVRSTLTATRGWGLLIGNVKGRKNWFYEWCRRVEKGLDPNAHFERIGWRDAVEAGVLDVEEIEDARRQYPEFVFRELYEAYASDDGGNPFGLDHIAANIVDFMPATKPVAWGVDLAKKQDYYVVIGLDEGGNVCHFDRWNGIPWGDSIRKTQALVGEDSPVLVDSTGLGDPVLEQLQVDHPNIQGYNFSNISKQRLMEGLAVAIQKHEITYPRGHIPDELETFEYDIRGGRTFYSTPEGYNDDCVCGLALARQAWVQTAPGQYMTEYYAQTLKRQHQLASAIDEPIVNTKPWRAEINIPSYEDLIQNELTQIYESIAKTHTNSNRNLCKLCNKKVDGNSRVTDGEFVWHMECA